MEGEPMSIMIAEVYDALLESGASEADQRQGSDQRKSLI